LKECLGSRDVAAVAESNIKEEGNMGILKTLFGASDAAAKTQTAGVGGQPATAPGGGEARLRPGRALTYDPSLVKSLKDDHQALVQIFQRIDATCRESSFAECKEALKHFRSRFTDHLIVENTRFYLYVKHAMQASDPASTEIARSFQQEMYQIAKVVTAFLDKYSGNEEELKSAAFAQELQGIGKALLERIEREEKALYPLYVPMG
jgi:regulator of sigma D